MAERAVIKLLAAVSTGLVCIAAGVLSACQTPASPSRPAPLEAAEAPPAASVPIDPLIADLVASAHRSPAFRSRDAARHPAETLSFFGLDPHDTVVEIWPGAGWYMELLAPFVRDWGQYYAALPPVSDPAGDSEAAVQRRTLYGMLNERPDLYGKVQVVEAGPGIRQILPEGTADVLLTFRNVHNWMRGGYEQDMFNAFYAALKPGGVLGVVEHRAKPRTALAAMRESGYVTEDYVILLAEAAGFELVARAQINANPRDTTDHPGGVWTLPPSLRLGEQQRARYLAIGESDRMTLKFAKPRWR